MRVVEREREIRSAQRRLVGILEGNASARGSIRLGHKGGQVEAMGLAFPSLGFWAGYGDETNRYWNAFGLGDPFGPTPNITVEVNPPRSGIDRRISGVILKDSQGVEYFGHRGRVGGGRTGIGKSSFFKWYPGPIERVEDGDRSSNVIVICALEDPALISKFARFTRLVADFKAHVTGDGSDVEAKHQFRPEYSGRHTRISTRDKIVEESSHGIVVDALHKYLDDLGIKSYNDQQRDLYTLHSREIDLLFEVKGGGDTQSVYTALGQLTYHGAEGLAKRLIAVLPGDTDSTSLRRLRDLGIHVVTYLFQDQAVQFHDLNDVCR